jgi:phage terminase large subunit-like protein
MGNELELIRALTALKQKEEENQATKFTPYDEQLEFLNSTAGIVCLVGGNRVGKTLSGSYAIKCHATGDYPSWWKGVRFAGPINIWVAGVTATRVRDTLQEKLFGRRGKMGTGMIPKKDIVIDSIIKKPGTPGAIDQIDIKHVAGGTSTIQFFSYEMESEKYMGSSVNLIWFDEEPPEDIYNECKMRVLDCAGSIFFTFTPLSGITPLYDNIMQDDSIHKVHLSMDAAKHLKKDDIEKLLDGMSDSEKKARRHGVATIGSGKVFNFEESEYSIEPFEIPPYWRRLGGLDVGGTHPTGALMACIDDASGTIYVTNEYRQAGKTAVEHAAHLKHWGVKFAVDKSAFQRSQGTLISTASIYQDEGLELVNAGNNSNTWKPSVEEVRRLIGSGCLYIFTTCNMLLQELRTYRVKTTENGGETVVKTNDDLVDPLRYICMNMDRLAEVPKRFKKSPKLKQFKPADPKVAY